MALAWRLVRTDPAASPLHTRLDSVVYLIRGARLAEASRVANEALASANGDPSITGRAHSFLGEVASIRGNLDETIREYALAISELESTSLVGSLARARRGRAEAYFNLTMVSSALYEVECARLLVSSITDPAVRRRATLESALCEGLIRIELGQTNAGLELWESSVHLITSDCDPLLVGLHDVLGGQALAAHTLARREGLRLLDRAADHFAAHNLPYYRAKTLESHGRRILVDDRGLAIEAMTQAADTYARVGATLQESRARRWLADVAHGESNQPRPSSNASSLSQGDDVEGIAVAGPTMRSLVELAICAANSESTVLVTGESGTGKELVARLVHNCSRRAGLPMVPFNCAAVPSDLVESILFGHRKGAFTGAFAAHRGVLREADGGTLFLDEIGELPLHLQAKLLRFLQEGEVLPVGEARPVHVDVRVIAATNRNLERDAMEGRFREDLFHRLNVIRLEVAPLRDRKDEIPILAARFASRIGERLRCAQVHLTAGAVTTLVNYDWPGNVRELGNILERSIALYGHTITRESIEAALGPSIRRQSGPETASVPLGRTAFPGKSLESAMTTFERDFLDKAIRSNGGNLSRSAESVGISLQRLRYRMRRLGMG
jgi:two-component system response regulator PilR (NtrC family)